MSEIVWVGPKVGGLVDQFVTLGAKWEIDGRPYGAAVQLDEKRGRTRERAERYLRRMQEVSFEFSADPSLKDKYASQLADRPGWRARVWRFLGRLAGRGEWGRMWLEANIDFYSLEWVWRPV